MEQTHTTYKLTTHIARIMFFGQDVDAATPLNRIVMNGLEEECNRVEGEGIHTRYTPVLTKWKYATMVQPCRIRVAYLFYVNGCKEARANLVLIILGP